MQPKSRRRRSCGGELTRARSAHASWISKCVVSMTRAGVIIWQERFQILFWIWDQLDSKQSVRLLVSCHGSRRYDKLATTDSRLVLDPGGVRRSDIKRGSEIERKENLWRLGGKSSRDGTLTGCLVDYKSSTCYLAKRMVIFPNASRAYLPVNVLFGIWQTLLP